MKLGIILASFGAADSKIREKTIDSLAADLKSNFVNFDIRQAYTSNFIRQKLKSQGIIISSIEEQIASLKSENVDKIVILPSHLTPGEEFENKILPFSANDVEILSPLFTLNCDTAFDKLAFETILSCFELFENEQLVLIGHGSPHKHNPVYENLQILADNLDLKVHIGVIETSDTPNFDDVIKRLRKNKISRILLAPMLFNGGVHVNEDIAGDNDNSWRSRLIELGYNVRICTDGLGSFEKFRLLYIKRLQDNLNYLSNKPVSDIMLKVI